MNNNQRAKAQRELSILIGEKVLGLLCEPNSVILFGLDKTDLLASAVSESGSIRIESLVFIFAQGMEQHLSPDLWVLQTERVIKSAYNGRDVMEVIDAIKSL